MNYDQCEAFARLHNRTFVIFPLYSRGQSQNYAIEQQMNIRDNNRELLYGYFVSGIPEMIMENIYAVRGITNGTISIQHTMLFNNTKGI